MVAQFDGFHRDLGRHSSHAAGGSIQSANPRLGQGQRDSVIDCRAGERKHDLAEEHLQTTRITRGVFLILVRKAQAPVWEVSVNGKQHHLERKKPMPYVNHYSFHILDPDWGHITIKISGHPPFAAQIMLNGHEYVACQAKRAGIAFTKEGNCFTHIADAAGLAKIADTLSEESAIGRLSQVCERWIYSSCLCFALDLEEQKTSGFRYQYSNYQVEYSRNLLFELGGRMERVFQALIDRSRTRLDLDTIKTILGYRRRPRYRTRKRKSAEWEVAVEKPTYDLTIFRLHCGKLTLKIYTKGERVLRIEAMAHNVKELDCGRNLEKFPRIIAELKGILERFMQALSCVDQCFIPDDTLENLPEPSGLARRKWGASISINCGCAAWPRHFWLSAGVPEDSRLRNWRSKWRSPTNSRKAAMVPVKPPTISRSCAGSRWWSGLARRVNTKPLPPASRPSPPW